MDDYMITRIGESIQKDFQFWGLLHNWYFTPASAFRSAFVSVQSITQNVYRFYRTVVASSRW